MPYAIMRFKKQKGGAVASCERHNERKKEAYKSNPDIDVERSKDNYHLIAPHNYTYKKELNRLIQDAGCRTRSDSVVMVETLVILVLKPIYPFAWILKDLSPSFLDYRLSIAHSPRRIPTRSDLYPMALHRSGYTEMGLSSQQFSAKAPS